MSEFSYPRINPNLGRTVLTKDLNYPKWRNESGISWYQIAGCLFETKRMPIIKKEIDRLSLELKNTKDIGKRTDLECSINALQSASLDVDYRSDYNKSELRVAKKCMKMFGIDLCEYRVGKHYQFTAKQSHFLFFLLTYDRKRGGYISKLKNYELSGISNEEELQFFRELVSYLNSIYEKEYNGSESVTQILGSIFFEKFGKK